MEVGNTTFYSLVFYDDLRSAEPNLMAGLLLLNRICLPMHLYRWTGTTDDGDGEYDTALHAGKKDMVMVMVIEAQR